MRFKSRDTLVFESTGREAYAFDGCIGLSQKLDAHYGWDGRIAAMDDSELTRAERVELANYMIERWKDYKNE